MSEQQSGRERRRFGRRETNLIASARLSTGTIAACTIRDLSEGGALLEFAADSGQPARLRLSWDGNHDVLCEVRHINGRMMGVQFVQFGIVSLERPMTMPTDEITRLPDPSETDSQPSRASAELVARVRSELCAAKIAVSDLKPVNCLESRSDVRLCDPQPAAVGVR